MMLPDPIQVNEDDEEEAYDHLDNENSDDDDDDDVDDDRINAIDGLSSDVLAALLEFQLGNNYDCDRQSLDEGTNNNERFGKDTLCATFRPEDASRIAETLRRLHDLDEYNNNHQYDNCVEAERLIVIPMLETIPSSKTTTDDRAIQLVNALEMNGVIRINNVLSKDVCQSCLDYVNDMLEHDDTVHHRSVQGQDQDHQQQQQVHYKNDNNQSSSIMFGNVFSREHRFDMYLHPTGIVQTILQSMLHSQSILGQLFIQLLQLQNNTHDDAEFHELSSLVSDPGSMSQPLHPDSPYYPIHAPLWTVFIALQDVTPEMGGTVVVPGTHTEKFHNLLNPSNDNDTTTYNDRHRHIRTTLMKECQYQRADLSVGDCIIMDARTFHYGDANTSNQRRTLLYFTIRNPYHQQRGYPDCGSLYPELDGTLKLSQYIQS
jgi:Phytanoyl-CoA dioxygenase (PhyH)